MKQISEHLSTELKWQGQNSPYSQLSYRLSYQLSKQLYSQPCTLLYYALYGQLPLDIAEYLTKAGLEAPGFPPIL